jgi:hypothetical protein
MIVQLYEIMESVFSHCADALTSCRRNRMDDLPTDAERALCEYERKLRVMPVGGLDLVAIECEVRALTEARGRELMAAALKRADTEAPQVEIDGQRWGNRRVQSAEYETLFGTVRVERSIYQLAGRGRVAVPLELRVGMVEGRYTPKMGRVMTRTLAVTTEQEGADLLAELGTAMVSSSTLSRIPRAMAARYETRREVLEVALRERDEIPEEAVTLQVAYDGVMVPQDGEHARARGRKTDSPDPPRYEQRYGPMGVDCPAANDGHVGRAWHEASVGTLAYFDREGRRLKTVYLGRMPEPLKSTLVKELHEELNAALAERPTFNVVFASDGAPAHWDALDAMARAIAPVCRGEIVKLVDAFHVAEYVKKAANAIAGDGTADAAILAATWRETLKEQNDGAKTVLRSMRAKKSGVPTQARREELATAIAYLATQHGLGRTNYAEATTKNYPIGTGITEAAGKTVIGTRMKRAGARFSQHGGQTILLFRTAILSERFDALHAELGSTYASTVKMAA